MTSALILAAGQGTRLRPLTDNRPKTLVPLLGKSLLERQLTILTSAAISPIAVATGYCANQIEALGLPCYFNPAYASTNMVESLFAARDFIADCRGDLIISYGDIIYQSNNLAILLATSGDIALMVDKGWYDLWQARMEDPLSDAETLQLDENNRIVELGKKPKDISQIQGQYTGLIKISAHKIHDFIAFYDSLDRSQPMDGQSFEQIYMTSFLQALINAGWHVQAAIVSHGWLEVDSTDDLAIYEKLHQQGKLAALWRDGV